MSDRDLLAIHRILFNDAGAARRLLDSAGSPEAALQALTAGRLSSELEQNVASDQRWLEARNHHLITVGDFPEALRVIGDPPFLLFAEGDVQLLNRHPIRVAIVGARKASAYGRHQATVMGEVLSQHGISVVSGLALGIDAAAHEGALRAAGSTIAVLGTGCDSVYPRRNWRLAERIASDGLLLSEYPTGTAAYPGNFPRRNRIVTGLCDATVVIEAATRSGSLISARLAAAEGRDVMAVPGQVTSRNAAGCHQLIRDGASLVESASDVLKELGLGGDLELELQGSLIDLKPEQKALLECLGQEPLTIDEILATITVSIDELTVCLVSLEVQGLVKSEGGRYRALDRWC